MFYRFARVICRFILAVLRRWRVYGAENLPAAGGMVVVSNHTSYWDPVVVGCALKRQVYFMAKAELFAIPLLGPVIRALGAFPVKRQSTDRQAVKTALNLLARGELVGIFPEGTRSHSGELLKPHVGAAVLACKAGVPLLPVALKGTRGIFGRVEVFVGEPIKLSFASKPAKQDLEEASDAVMKKIAGLLKTK